MRVGARLTTRNPSLDFIRDPNVLCVFQRFRKTRSLSLKSLPTFHAHQYSRAPAALRQYDRAMYEATDHLILSVSQIGNRHHISKYTHVITSQRASDVYTYAILHPTGSTVKLPLPRRCRCGRIVVGKTHQLNDEEITEGAEMSTMTIELPEKVGQEIRYSGVPQWKIEKVVTDFLELYLQEIKRAPTIHSQTTWGDGVEFARRVIANNRALFEELAQH